MVSHVPRIRYAVWCYVSHEFNENEFDLKSVHKAGNTSIHHSKATNTTTEVNSIGRQILRLEVLRVKF